VYVSVALADGVITAGEEKFLLAKGKELQIAPQTVKDVIRAEVHKAEASARARATEEAERKAAEELERRRKAQARAAEERRRREEEEARRLEEERRAKEEAERKAAEELERRRKAEARAAEEHRRREEEIARRLEALRKWQEEQRRAKKEALRKWISAALPALGIAALAVVGILLHLWLLQRTTLSFDFVAGGQSVKADSDLRVSWNGQPVATGDRLPPGKGKLRVESAKYDPAEFEKTIRYGRKNHLGALGLLRSKGAIEILSPKPAIDFVVYREDQIVTNGTTPARVIDIPVDWYQIVAAYKNYTHSTRIEVLRNATNTWIPDFDLGSASIASSPSPATYLMRKGTKTISTGQTPAKIDDLESGIYDLVLHYKNITETQTMLVRRGTSTERTVDFKVGSVEITSVPPGAEYELRGGDSVQAQGKTPTVVQDLPIGRYELRVKTGVLSSWRFITVQHGEATRHQIVFDGSLLVKSEPSNASVLQDDRVLGKTPFALDQVAPGTMHLTVEMEGYSTVSLSGDITSGQRTELKAVLVNSELQNAVADAESHLREGRLPDAEQAILTALRIAPNAPGLADLRTRIDAAKKELAEASAEAEDHLRQGRLADAEQAILKALRIAPNAPDLAALRSRIDDAEKELAKAIAEAEGHLRWGRLADAEQAALRALRIAPNAPGLAELRRRIDLAKARKIEEEVSEGFRGFKLGRYEGRATNTTANAKGKAVFEIKTIDRTSGAVTAIFEASQGLVGNGTLRGSIDASGLMELSGPFSSGGALHILARINGNVIRAKYRLGNRTLQHNGVFRVTAASLPKGPFADLVARIPGSGLFDTRTVELRYPFDAVWRALGQTLAKQKEKGIREDKENGIIVTEETKHGIFAFEQSFRYLIHLEKHGEESSKLTFKIYHYDISMLKVPCDKQVLDSDARSFLKRIDQALSKKEVSR